MHLCGPGPRRPLRPPDLLRPRSRLARASLPGRFLRIDQRSCPPPPFLGWGAPSTQYLADLQQLVAGVRADLAAPGLVFLCGQLGTVDHAPEPTWIGVQEAQRSAVALDPTNDLASLALAADGTSVALRYERPVSGGAPSLYRAADAVGVLGVSSVSVAGDTVTVAFSRAMGAGGRLAYGFSDVPTDAWVRDAADACPVPCLTGLVVSP